MNWAHRSDGRRLLATKPSDHDKKGRELKFVYSTLISIVLLTSRQGVLIPISLIASGSSLPRMMDSHRRISGRFSYLNATR